jgi:hypothetical protein
MLTVVLLLLLPVVLGMSLMRVFLLPRDLWTGRARINPRRKALCAFAFGIMYCALAIYTVLVLCALARAFWTPPRTIYDFFAAAFVALAYPPMYVAFEWVLYYSVKSVPQA